MMPWFRIVTGCKGKQFWTFKQLLFGLRITTKQSKRTIIILKVHFLKHLLHSWRHFMATAPLKLHWSLNEAHNQGIHHPHLWKGSFKINWQNNKIEPVFSYSIIYRNKYYLIIIIIIIIYRNKYYLYLNFKHCFMLKGDKTNFTKCLQTITFTNKTNWNHV